ncbi:hypothetical protein [Nostoc sp.]
MNQRRYQAQGQKVIAGTNFDANILIYAVILKFLDLTAKTYLNQV